MKANLLSISALVLFCATIHAAEIKVSSPDGKEVITVTDAGGLSYTVTFDGREVVAKTRFGITQLRSGFALPTQGMDKEQTKTQTQPCLRTNTWTGPEK